MVGESDGGRERKRDENKIRWGGTGDGGKTPGEKKTRMDFHVHTINLHKYV